jgi:hypothetical protein
MLRVILWALLGLTALVTLIEAPAVLLIVGAYKVKRGVRHWQESRERQHA